MVRMLSAAILISGMAIFAFAQAPLAKDAVKKQTSKTAQTREFLETEFEVPEELRENPEQFGTILKWVSKRLAEEKKEVAILVDDESFKEDAADAPSTLEIMVRLPALVKKASAREILGWSASQLRATFLIKNGRVIIVPKQAAEVPRLLDQHVAMRVREMPLLAAVEELADQTGIAIQIDPRCADGGSNVTLRAENMTARGVLLSWADFFDLKVVEDEDRVTVLPRVEYFKKLRAESEEAKLENMIREVRPGPRVRRASPVGAP